MARLLQKAPQTMRQLALGILLLFALTLVSCVRPPGVSAINVVYPRGHCLVLPEVGQVMERTTVLQKYQLRGTVHAEDPGKPLLDAVLQGHVDAVLATDGTALMLLSRGFRGKIVGSYGAAGRAGLVVSSRSPIRTMSELHGKAIAATEGTTPWALLRCWLAENGPATARIVNRPVDRLPGVLDAPVLLADPVLDQVVSTGQARVLHQEAMLSVVLVSANFLERDPEAAERFMAACTDAAWFVASHRQPCETWAAALSGVPASALDDLLGENPVYHAGAVQDISVDPQPLADVLQRLADRLLQSHVLSNPVHVGEYIDSDFANRSRARFKGYYDPGSVRILSQ
ncbi:MAG: ABC transporter substrate-binding protein [Candidatus Xenobia bacterium]